MSIYTIYKILNKINGKIYIGFDSNWPTRREQHIKAYKTGNSHLYYAIRKYDLDNFEFHVIYQAKESTLPRNSHTLNVMEAHFIREYDSFGANGYNKTLGGDGSPGHVVSSEVKIALSKYNKGFAVVKSTISGDVIRVSVDDPRILSGELVGATKGTTSSAETRTKISAGSSGIPKSEKHKQKISSANKGKQSPFKGVERGSYGEKTCPHCGKIGGSRAMSRWHFNNCKLNKM